MKMIDTQLFSLRVGDGDVGKNTRSVDRVGVSQDSTFSFPTKRSKPWYLRRLPIGGRLFSAEARAYSLSP